jgi:hypothetical protein
MQHQSKTTIIETARPLSDLEKAIVELERRAATTAPVTIATGTLVPRTQLAVMPEAFNVRGERLDEYHLHQLGRALVSKGDLAPILVLAVGDRLIVVDGHHRLEAYRRAKRAEVPIEGFVGSPREAMLEAVERNTAAILPMDNRQRQNLAWRLTNAAFTLKQVSRGTGISRAQVSIMRKVMKSLGDDAGGHATWNDARRAADGRQPFDLSDDEREAALQAHMQTLADRMQKTFGNRLVRNPEIAAGALAIYCGRMLREVVRFLHDHLPDNGESLFEDEASEF